MRVHKWVYVSEPLPNKKGTPYKIWRTFKWAPRPESGLDCLIGADLALAALFGSDLARGREEIALLQSGEGGYCRVGCREGV